jgi:hypothetical protein
MTRKPPTSVGAGFTRSAPIPPAIEVERGADGEMANLISRLPSLTPQQVHVLMMLAEVLAQRRMRRLGKPGKRLRSQDRLCHELPGLPNIAKVTNTSLPAGPDDVAVGPDREAYEPTT